MRGLTQDASRASQEDAHDDRSHVLNVPDIFTGGGRKSYGERSEKIQSGS